MVDRIEKPAKDNIGKDKDKGKMDLIGFPQSRVRGFIDDLVDGKD